MLIGNAVDRKLIASVDEPVFKFFPDYVSLRTPAKDRILLGFYVLIEASKGANFSGMSEMLFAASKA